MTTNRSLLEEIREQTTETRVKMAKVEEHLKNLNGSTRKHEKNIDELYAKTNENKLSIGKIVAIWGALTVVLGALGSYLYSLLKIGR